MIVNIVLEVKLQLPADTCTEDVVVAPVDMINVRAETRHANFVRRFLSLILRLVIPLLLRYQAHLTRVRPWVVAFDAQVFLEAHQLDGTEVVAVEAQCHFDHNERFLVALGPRAIQALQRRRQPLHLGPLTTTER